MRDRLVRDVQLDFLQEPPALRLCRSQTRASLSRVVALRSAAIPVAACLIHPARGQGHLRMDAQRDIRCGFDGYWPSIA